MLFISPMYNHCQKYICYVMAFSEHIFMQCSKTHALVYANISVASKEVEHEQMTTLSSEADFVLFSHKFAASNKCL